MSNHIPLLANHMVHLRHSRLQQRGHTLAQVLVGMALSMLVISAALAVFAWVQISHRQMQTQADAQQRLRTTLQRLRERVQRAGATELVFDTKGKAADEPISNGLQGHDNGLTLVHARSLTPSDCQGHQASDWFLLADDFSLNARQELVCKDSWREDSKDQALVDGVRSVQFLFAEQRPGLSPQMQWLQANEVSDWGAVLGVASCIQVQISGSTPVPRSSPCSTSAHGLAWRGVAFVRHQAP